MFTAGVALWWEKSSHGKTKRKLNNQIAELEGTIKETETVFSRRAIKVEDLESENEDLQSLIDDRDENILALAETNLRIRNKYFICHKTLFNLQN